MTQDDIEKLAYLRGLELQEKRDLVSLTFDANHLKSIHAYLFQDSEKYRNSGAFRLPKNDVHSKNRTDTYSVRKPFFYEPSPSEHKVDAFIKQADTNLSLSKSTNDKIEILSNLYASLDYEHPFVEGNSRTIRTFLEHMAQKHGIDLDWRHTAQNKDEFYRARDFEIAKRNAELKPSSDIESYMLEETKRYNTKEFIASQIATHNGRYLHQIIKDCCSYPNKELLEKLNTTQIKKDHPNLSNQDIQKIQLYKDHILAQYPNPKAQQAILEKINNQLPEIASGKISLPDLPTIEKDTNKDKGR